MMGDAGGYDGDLQYVKGRSLRLLRDSLVNV